MAQVPANQNGEAQNETAAGVVLDAPFSFRVMGVPGDLVGSQHGQSSGGTQELGMDHLLTDTKIFQCLPGEQHPDIQAEFQPCPEVS